MSLDWRGIPCLTIGIGDAHMSREDYEQLRRRRHRVAEGFMRLVRFHPSKAKDIATAGDADQGMRKLRWFEMLGYSNNPPPPDLPTPLQNEASQPRIDPPQPRRGRWS